MPYAIVETTDALGGTELLVAPESWILQKPGGTPVLCWPNVRNIGTLNTLLEDDLSVPGKMWEKHKCEIKCGNVASLLTAGTMLEALQRSGESVAAKGATSTAPVQKNAASVDLRMNSELVEVDDDDDGGEDFSIPLDTCSSYNDRSTGDPLEKVAPNDPSSVEMYNELKRLVEQNHKNAMKKLNDGFYSLQQSLVSVAMPYVIVETTDAIGRKELFAAPESWIQTDQRKTTYLSWPNARTSAKLSELLSDDRSVPSVVWDRHECEVICRNISSLESADKVLETMQKQCKELLGSSAMDTEEMSGSECSTEDEQLSQIGAWTTVDKNIGMPYAVVESTDAIGKKELFIAPETWIQTDPLKTTYLSWPNVRTISKLRALLADEFSVPSVVWERQECEVICRNIPSLESADKLLDTMQKQCKEQSSISVMDADEMIVSECSTEDESSPQNDPFNAIEENLELTAQEKEEDPLVDMKPFPQLLNLIFELKSLIEYNQQEIGKKLEEGFFRVQRTIISLTEKNHEWIRKDLHLNSVCEHGMERFKINAFKTKEELDVFEQQLNDAEYKKKVQNWIDFAVGHTQTANHRMHELIDLIFDRKLFACFTCQ
uniref:DUF4806 domain-containing protein n=1 Tax=Anopheles dirus TaxID=7168 RepID=A0A182N3V4_9DIPT